MQDSWKATDRLTVDYGLRWEAQVQPDPITDPEEVFFAGFIGREVTNETGSYEFPSSGRIPSDRDMLQPRLGVAWDVRGDGRTLARASAGLYHARIPGLNLASSRSTNGSRGQSIFRSSALTPVLGPPPPFGELVPPPPGKPFRPNIYVFHRDFENPRTLSLHAGLERELHDSVVGSLDYTHARADGLTRFVNHNDAAFGSPWSSGLGADGGNGLGDLTVVESTARSRYHGLGLGLRRTGGEGEVQFQVNYTLSWDRSDDDNERDPFTFRYVDPTRLEREWGWSDRDQRHRLNAWALAPLPGGLFLNQRLSWYSPQPVSEACGDDGRGTGRPAVNPWGALSDRICPDGTILRRNTLRKERGFFSWDVRLTRPIPLGEGRLEAIVEVFNVLDTDNYREPSSAGLLFNFDGTVQSGLGDPREVQLGLRCAW